MIYNQSLFRQHNEFTELNKKTSRSHSLPHFLIVRIWETVFSLFLLIASPLEHNLILFFFFPRQFPLTLVGLTVKKNKTKQQPLFREKLLPLFLFFKSLI